MALWNQNSGYGQAFFNAIMSQVPAFGAVKVVVNSGNSNRQYYQRLQDLFDIDPNGRVRFFTSVLAAYNDTETNNNDVLLLDANSSHVLAESLTVSKSRIHFLGMDGGGRMLQQGAKIENTDGTAAVFVLKNTGTRNSYINVKVIQVDDDSTSLTVFQEGGEGTYFQNSSFVFQVADNLDETDAYEFVMGGDSCTFKECTFGNDTLLTSAARAVMAIDRVNGTQEMKSNFFKDCMWQINSSSATAHFIRVLANTDMKFGQTFVDPIFMAALTNSMGTSTLTEAVENEVQAVEGNMLFIRPATNTTDFATTSNGNTNIKVVAATSVNAAIEGIAPVA